LAVAQRHSHADPAMTLRVYSHLFEGVQEGLPERLDALRARTEEAADDGVVVDLAVARAGHRWDTRDTRKPQKGGQIR
jgi:hypothetical protein